MCRSSARDTRHIANMVVYYGVIQEIILLDYHMFQVPIFKCKWANKGNGVREDEDFTLVNLNVNQSAYRDDLYILASQAKQVFYSKEDDSSPWLVVMRAPPRRYHELETKEEFVAPLSVPEIEDLGNQSSDDESFSVRDDCVMTTGDANKSRRSKRKKGLAPETQDEVDTTHHNEEEDVCAQNDQETIQPAQEGATETQEEKNKSRETRGPTKMREVAKHHDDKVDVEYTLLAWKNWVKSRSSPEFKVKSDKYIALRKAQIPHTTSRKGMLRVAHEMRNKSSEPSKVTRSKVWVAGHTHSDGIPVRPEFVETIEHIKSIDSEMGSTASTGVKDDVAPLDRILIFDWNREDMIVAEGLLISTHPKELANNIPLGSNAASVKVHMVINKDAYQWRPTSEMILMGEIVAEGKICSTNPEDKVHFVPLGPDASKVWVQVLEIGSAKVWRANSEVKFIGDALETTIAWPNDKLQFL
ncbi:unnamed protein product [Arabidopsis arenosa]|uniref:DUF4216 domain-containing protein n=1 Tax=Arabidopsis arenosa TaxID=38785 RepID=A0A8S2A183_ARAAE|nr:unnamed protein product [Arabidopsis arenosa]